MTPTALVPISKSVVDFASEANRHHQLVGKAGQAMVEHAIAAGEALHAAEQLIPGGHWMAWLRENFDGAIGTAHLYMRLADFQDEVRERGLEGIVEARDYIVRLKAPRRRNGPKERYPAWMMEEAVRLADAGTSINAIAKTFGVTNPTVVRWVHPEVHRRRKEQERVRRLERRQAERQAKEEARQRAIKRAARKAGGAIAETYSMAERMQDVLGQAHSEAQDREVREALSLAGQHYRKMRDEIVRALGVI